MTQIIALFPRYELYDMSEMSFYKTSSFSLFITIEL